MNPFQYKDQELYIEDVKLKDLAVKFGTPLYVYSHSYLKKQFQDFDQAFSEQDHVICFSMKCNSNLAILKSFANLGAGVDIVSGGELFRALKAGIPANKIVFSGVGKTTQDIRFALESKIMMFNVESRDELIRINEVATQLSCKAPVALRINPDVDPKTHPYITTGLKKSKFGIHIDDALDAYQEAKTLGHIEVIGLDCHIGSQLTDTSPFVDALQRLNHLIHKLSEIGIRIQKLDLGGGLGITYSKENPPSVKEYAEKLLSTLEHKDLTLVFEPGRFMMGNAGCLLTQTIYNKSRDNKHFTIVDAAMNDLIRPALYQGHHEILALVEKNAPKKVVDVVGPICETGDFFALDRELPEFAQGDFMAVMSAGAYGFVMGSQYNSRPRPAEILVQGDQYSEVRKRESWEDLISGESIPKWLDN